MNECKNAADFEKANEFFATPEYIMDPKFRQKASEHILNITKG